MKMTFRRALRAELLRLRRSSLIPLHAALALGLGVAAGAYFAFAPWDSLLGTDAFFQMLGAGAPLLVGLSCGLSAEAEREAGEGANVLGMPSRRVVVAAKVAALWLLGLAAAVVAALAFYGVLAAAGRAVVSLTTCVAAAGGIAAGSLGLYAALLWVAFRFGRNAAIGVGALGVFLALASMGGLANGLVTGTLSGGFGAGLAAVIPFSWASRFGSLIVELAIVGGLPEAAALAKSLQIIAAFCAAFTLAAGALMFARVNRFENKRRIEE